MRFLTEKISNSKKPSVKSLKNKYILLVNRHGAKSVSTWCGFFNHATNRYESVYLSLREIFGNEEFNINEYNGKLQFPISMDVYLVDKICFDFYKKIKNKRDFLVFLDNLY